MGRNLDKRILKKLPAEVRREYLDQASRFYLPLKLPREELLALFNGVRSKELAQRFLFNIRMFQYCDQQINPEDNILRSVLIVSMLEAVESSVSGGSQKSASAIEAGLLRLDISDKQVLISRYEYLRKCRGKTSFYKLYHEDILKSDSPLWVDVEPQEIGMSDKKVNRYLKKVATILWEARCFVLHEFMHSSFTTRKDEFGNPVMLFSFFEINRNKKKSKLKKLHLHTSLSTEDFIIVMKRAIYKAMQHAQKVSIKL